MRELPLLISVPHGGLWIPQEVDDLCALSQADILADADEGAMEIFHPLGPAVAALVATPYARSVVDVDRAEGAHRRRESRGIRTMWGAPVYHTMPSRYTVEILLQRYHRPYHDRLKRHARLAALGIDCHTMATLGPPGGHDQGQSRPKICVASGGGAIPEEWYQELALALQDAFEVPVSLDLPFRGGYVTRSRPGGIPWVQVLLSRADWVTPEEKSSALLRGLRKFSERVLDAPGPRRNRAPVPVDSLSVQRES